MEQRLAQLENRLRRLEDELSIQRLIGSYGPSVDSGRSQSAAALWTEDGVYDVGGLGITVGATAVAALLDGSVHKELIGAGAGHVLSLPQVQIDSDSAVAIGYSVVYRWDGSAFIVHRVAANRWELERVSSVWRVRRRVNRLLNGSAEARALLVG
jgi:hypothetical protein